MTNPTVGSTALSPRQSHIEQVVFHCAPSLGLLDSWISIMWSIKEKKQGISFVFLAEDPDILATIGNNWLYPLAKRLFDKAAYKTESGQWHLCNSFEDAVAVAGKGSVKARLQNALPKRYSQGFLSGRARKAIIRLLIQPISRYLKKRDVENCQVALMTNLSDALNVDSNKTVLLFDLSQIKRTNELNVVFDRAPKVSLLHGIVVKGVGSSARSLAQKVVDAENIFALLHSPTEVEYYKKQYGIKSSNIRVIGVPRHDRGWMQFIAGQVDSNETLFGGRKYILVISRPSNQTYHPRDRKLESIRDIAKAARRYGLPMVVKLHPKEKKDGSFEQVFGASEYGKNWLYSDCHSFVLAQRAEFAVSFWSGVALDVLQFDVPTIERLDLRGLPSVDDKDALRDSDGQPVFAQRYLGHVLGSSDSDSFMAHVERIMTDKQQVIEDLKLHYERDFPQIDDINGQVADWILGLRQCASSVSPFGEKSPQKSEGQYDQN